MKNSLLESTLNTRRLRSGDNRYIRSDVPVSPTPEDIDFLLANNILTLIDLRTPEEAERRPCFAANDPRFTYRVMTVTGGNAVPAAADLVSASYLNMADSTMVGIIGAIENASSGVMYFCNAGKDRTGVVSAILMKRMGCSDEDIIADYLESAENLREMLESYADSVPDIDICVITPCRRYMEEFLQGISEHPLIKK